MKREQCTEIETVILRHDIASETSVLKRKMPSTPAHEFHVHKDGETPMGGAG